MSNIIFEMQFASRVQRLNSARFSNSVGSYYRCNYRMTADFPDVTQCAKLSYQYLVINLAMPQDELARLAEQAARSAANSAEQQDFDMEDYNDALSGCRPVQISHAGGEMAAMAKALIPR